MVMSNKISFVRDEIKTILDSEKEPKPSGGVGSFISRVKYALFLGFKEKEIIVFGFLQWVSVAIGYLLWVQMLDWIPEEVWRSTEKSNKGSIADWVLIFWSFICIGVAAFPIGILSGCMGAAHFLHKQGKESTVAACFKLVLPQSWPLWSFHWVDGWITVGQMLGRIPSKESFKFKERALSEALYYAWKLGVAGVLPSMLLGNGLIKSGKNSIVFVKDNFIEVAKLRGGYSALCWILGIASYVGSIFFIREFEIIPKSGEVYSHIYTIYLWLTVPILMSVAVLMLLLRPIYIISLCDIYSDYLDGKGEEVQLPDSPSKGLSVIVAFGCLCVFVAVIYFYRNELGIVDMLSTPYGHEYKP